MHSDQLILSKGHAAVSLYACLAKKGFVKKSDLDRFGSSGSIYEEHPNSNIPTVLSQSLFISSLQKLKLSGLT
jgi:transketolase N-terminal domain/subunit